MPSIKTTCKVTKWEEDRTLTDTPRITPAKCETFCESIKGTINSTLDLIYTPDGNSVFPFSEIVEAEDFGGKKGSFMSMGSGSFDGKTNYLNAEFTIVEGTGRGELEGIKGKGTFFTSVEDSHNVEYVFEVEFA